MENEKNIQQPEDNGWLDQWLAEHTPAEEIGPDEGAISGAGLSDISDMELEKIIQEASSDDWLQIDTEPEPVIDIDISNDAEPQQVEEEAPAAPSEEAEQESKNEDEEEETGPVRKVRPTPLRLRPVRHSPSAVCGTAFCHDPLHG